MALIIIICRSYYVIISTLTYLRKSKITVYATQTAYHIIFFTNPMRIISGEPFGIISSESFFNFGSYIIMNSSNWLDMQSHVSELWNNHWRIYICVHLALVVTSSHYLTSFKGIFTRLYGCLHYYLCRCAKILARHHNIRRRCFCLVHSCSAITFIHCI